MKMRVEHLVPLSRQALELLNALRPLTGNGRWVFPQASAPMMPLPENAITHTLKALGYFGLMTAHGFRAMASTLLNEMGFNSDWIERQLAHASHGVRADYNRAQYLSERKTMMQTWADHLDGLARAAEG